MSYVIDTDIPLPPPSNRGGNWKGPKSALTAALSQLEPGHSVLAPLYTEFRSAQQWIYRQAPKRYLTRKIAGQGWRIWRVA